VNEYAYTKKEFSKAWGVDGYKEDFVLYNQEHNENFNTLYDKLVKPFENKQHACLEIGCGGGIWTNKMIDGFKYVTALDVIPKSKNLNKKVLYYELENFDYGCSPISNDSIDFVFSFGVFCHLPVSAQSEYIKNILRVLKKGGNAVIMFADWETHPYFKTIVTNKYEYQEKPSTDAVGGWFYMDKKLIKEIMEKNGIIKYTDLTPFFRDRIINFTKL